YQNCLDVTAIHSSVNKKLFFISEKAEVKLLVKAEPNTAKAAFSKSTYEGHRYNCFCCREQLWSRITGKPSSTHSDEFNDFVDYLVAHIIYDSSRSLSQTAKEKLEQAVYYLLKLPSPPLVSLPQPC
ncbi:hypothetical protein A0J61_02862, partial [Choanephora cucurbitarum]